MRGLVVGGGSIGGRHLKNLKALGVAHLALVEPDAERRRTASEAAGAEAFEALDLALDWEPDFVVVATPSHLHLAPALEAARRGCHLFIEKPLSHTLDDVETLCDEAEKRGLVTMVACNMRFHPGPAAIKGLLEERAVGQIMAGRLQTGSYLPRWRPGQDYRQSYSASPEWGGVILDAIHEIDLALWYLGPGRVHSAAHVPADVLGLRTEGLAEIILRHESGVLSSVHLNYVQRDYRRTCQMIGDQGSIYWDFAARQVLVYGADGELAQTLSEPAGWEGNQMYLDEMTHFLEAVRLGRGTANPLAAGVAALKVALAAREMGRAFVS